MIRKYLPTRRKLRRRWVDFQIVLLRLFGVRYLKQSNANIVELDVGRFGYMGFGASVGWILAAYIARDRMQARLVILNPDRWPFGGADDAGDLTRFLDFPDAEIRYGASTAGALPIAFGSWINLSKWGYDDPLSNPHCLFGYIPQGFEDLEEYRNSLLQKVYTPSPFSQKYLDNALRHFPQKYIAWHVRRGDKTRGHWKEDDPVDLPTYIDTTRALIEDGAISSKVIVLCTDSNTVVEEAQKLIARELPKFHLFVDPEEKRWDGYCAMQRTGKINDSDVMVSEVLNAQKILEIMRRAEYLIGCNSSLLFRTASLLRPNVKNVHSFSENKVWKKYYPV